MLTAPLLLALAQAKAPDPKPQIEAYFAADVLTAEGRAERRRILGELARVELTPAEAVTHQKAILKRWDKGPELEKDKGQVHFWEKEKKGLFIVGGNAKKPKGLAICMHGGGVGQGDAWSAHGAYDAALANLDWLALYPEVLEKTECGWTDAGTEEWVLELAERARRTWKIDPDRVYSCRTCATSRSASTSRTTTRTCRPTRTASPRRSSRRSRRSTAATTSSTGRSRGASTTHRRAGSRRTSRRSRRSSAARTPTRSCGSP
jgi:hypothetical protein